ncbi:MAG: methyltransferase domain-containing protein [Candidatus Methylacidiphilales bacterium]|nr:methyltransferase domain-containing protein [Candidatus Methylacidiphilales bacterium]
MSQEILVAGASMSFLPSDRLLTGYAWDGLTAAASIHPLGRVESTLLLGLGAGTAVRQIFHLFPRSCMTAVDLDARMIHLARKALKTHRRRMDIRQADAGEWVKQATPGRFDLVLDDVYASGAEDVFRPILPDIAWVRHLATLCRPQGLVALNLVIGPGHGRVRRQARQAFRHLFAHTGVIRPAKGMNEILWGSQAKPYRAGWRQAEGCWDHPSDRRDWRRIGFGRNPAARVSLKPDRL